MKRVAAIVLIGLGAFLLVLAPLAKWYLAPKLQAQSVASGCDPGPLCDGGVSLSPSTGTATTLFDPATLTSKSNVAIESMNRVRVDLESSSGPNHQTVYESFTNTTDDTGTTIDAGTERIAFNGVTSQMIDCCGANENGDAITDFSGIAPYKFPFGTKQQTYQYFDGTLAKSLPMVFQDEEEVNGLKVYKFVQTIDPAQTGELEVPGDLVGQPDEASVTAPRYYQNVRTVWVEPTTGVVVKGQEQQKQYLAGADGSAALVIIEATVGFTDENISEAVKTAKDGASQLNLIQKTLPLVGLILGLVLLVGGFFLLRRGADDAKAATTA